MAENPMVQRAEFVRDIKDSAYRVVEKPLTPTEKLWNHDAFRKAVDPSGEVVAHLIDTR